MTAVLFNDITALSAGNSRRRRGSQRASPGVFQVEFFSKKKKLNKYKKEEKYT